MKTGEMVVDRIHLSIIYFRSNYRRGNLNLTIIGNVDDDLCNIKISTMNT